MPASRGQSLIETLVALSVMVIGIAGAVSLGIISIRAGQTSELDVVAENLAREGIEAARSMRDYNWTQGKTWDTGLQAGKSYRVIVGEAGDPAAGQVELEGAPSGEPLGDPFFHLCRTSQGQYLHADGPGIMDQCESNDWEETVFNRRVTMAKEGGADKLRVTCEVRRSGGVGVVTYTVVEDLYNWKPN